MNKAFLLLFFVGCVNLVFGQEGKQQDEEPPKPPPSKPAKAADRKTRTYVVEYDFKTGFFPDRKRLKPRVDVPVVFKIKNINRLAYTLSILSKDSVIGFSDFNGLESLLKTEEEKKIAENLKKADTNPVQQNNMISVNSEDFLKTDTKKIPNDLTGLVNAINQTNVALLDELNGKINELSAPQDTVVKLSKVEIPKSLTDIFPYHFKTQNDMADLYLKIVDKYQALISLGNDYLEIKTFINNPLLDRAEVDKKNEKLETVYNDFHKHKNSLSDFNLLVNKFQNLYSAIKANPEVTQNANYGGRIKLFSIVDNLSLEVVAIKQQVEAVKFDVLKQNIDQIYQLLISNTDKKSIFEFVSDPIQPFQDVAIFKVKIEKNDKNSSMFFNERNFSHKEFTRHGVRFDLNVGVAGSFYNKKSFYDIKRDSSGKNLITNADRSGFSPSFVGFFTASRRSATHWTYGLSTGLGISADNGTITIDNFFIGPNLTVGKYERLNLITGVSFKNLPQLNSGFSVGEAVANDKTLDAITTKSYQTGFFIALTYNLTNGVKNNIKQIRNFL